jgi:hypothetical protein
MRRYWRASHQQQQRARVALRDDDVRDDEE